MPVGDAFRSAAALSTITVGGRTNRSEASMYPTLVTGLNTLLPTGFEARSLAAAASSGGHPDLQIVDRRGGVVAHIEVKLTSTLDDVFLVDPKTGLSQAQKYRKDGIPVWLTDAIGWWDISQADERSVPISSFVEDDTTSDVASEAQLKSWLHSVCGVRARHNLESAVSAITGVIAQINSAPTDVLADGWEIVRSGLGMTLNDDTLDGGGVGEIVTFTLLSIATQLSEIPTASFVASATHEWTATSATWNPSDLPAMMGATLRSFRDEDRRLNILGPNGWVAIRAVAAWLTDSGKSDRWGRLSNLWDTYLHRVGRRKTLGSWQTPRAVADYQAAQVSDALRALGYSGLADPAVTVIDPCCGTGVYLDAVVADAVAGGSPPEGFNAPIGGGRPRLIGVDVSSTAIAAAHIRIAATGTRPALHMTDTLATGASSSMLRLFDDGAGSGNPIVAAARDEYNEVQRWASRDPQRDPVLAVIGNPPYLRSGLHRTRYTAQGWWSDFFDQWRSGSGGHGGGIFDLFTAFWAWSVALCSADHPQVPAGSHTQPLKTMFGVISFICNRNLVAGTHYAPMRRWLELNASSIEITDFGPGARGGRAGRWSDQPFEIATGVAIVTARFDRSSTPTVVRYRQAIWQGNAISLRTEWSQGWGSVDRPTRRLPGDVTSTRGIITTDNDRWIHVDADRDFGTRHAYRAFDNRWSPTVPPRPAPRTRPPLPDEAKPGASWRVDALFGPHREFVRSGGWYALLQAASARPGPAIHSTRHVPDCDIFKGSEGCQVVRVGPGCQVPHDYQEWAAALAVDGQQFWLYALAAGHHRGYWTAGTELAAQLAERRVDPPLTDDRAVVARLVDLGGELVDLWSLDTVIPTPFTGGPGSWHFVGHDDAEAVVIHGRKALAKWREARPGVWDQRRAAEYARSVAAVLRVSEIADEVASVLPTG